MKKTLAILFCLCGFAGMSYASINVDFSKGSFGAPGSGKENVWTSNNGALVITINTEGNFQFDVANNSITADESISGKVGSSSLTINIAISEAYQEEYKVAGVNFTLTNATPDASSKINVFDDDGTKIVDKLGGNNSEKVIEATDETNDGQIDIRIEKQNNNTAFNIKLTMLLVTTTISGDNERHPIPGQCYKITFPDTDPDGSGPLTDYYFTNEEDSLFVIGPSAETDFHNLFASNSNIASNHYLTINGVTDDTYSRSSAVDIFMTNNFHNALQFSNGEYLAYDKSNHQLTTSSVIVEDNTQNITTDIDLIAVPYPYINVTLVSEWDTYSDCSTGAFGTVYLPFPMTIPEGIEAYAGTSFNNANVLLERVGESAEALPAGAYLLHGANAGTITFLPAKTAPCAGPSKNIFFGSTKNPWKPTGDAALYTSEGLGSMLPYVLARTVSDTKTKVKENVQLGFYKYTAKTYPKGKVVFDSKVDSGSKAPVKFIFVPKTDGINTATHNSSNNIYDLTGRKLSGFVNGINIYNGKKVIK